MTGKTRRDRVEQLSLSDAARNLLEECRMVLPGIQALFGFQLVAVFSQRFGSLLTQGQQRMHLVAITLVALAVAFIMGPAAYHRQTAPEKVSDQFIRVSTRLLLLSMLPLALGICIDLYLIAVVLLNPTGAAALASLVLLIYLGIWFALPWTSKSGRNSG